MSTARMGDRLTSPSSCVAAGGSARSGAHPLSGMFWRGGACFACVCGGRAQIPLQRQADCRRAASRGCPPSRGPGRGVHGPGGQPHRSGGRGVAPPWAPRDSTRSFGIQFEANRLAAAGGEPYATVVTQLVDLRVAWVAGFLPGPRSIGGRRRKQRWRSSTDCCSCVRLPAPQRQTGRQNALGFGASERRSVGAFYGCADS